MVTSSGSGRTGFGLRISGDGDVGGGVSGVRLVLGPGRGGLWLSGAWSGARVPARRPVRVRHRGHEGVRGHRVRHRVIGRGQGRGRDQEVVGVKKTPV